MIKGTISKYSYILSGSNNFIHPEIKGAVVGGVIRIARIRCLAAILSGCYLPYAWSVDVEADIDVDFHKLGIGYAHLVSFTAEPEVAAGRYTIEGDSSGNEDSTLKTTKLPLYKEFTSDDRDWAWYLRGAANYSSLEQTVVAIFHHQIDRASI